MGVAFYRQRYSAWREVRDLETPYPAGRKPNSCADAHYLAEVWVDRAQYERNVTEKWVEAHTLDDFVVRDGNRAWHKAVREVQKVYPGTESWLLSCSWSEGRHGRWVSYRGLYTPEYAAANYIVGGWMQFKWPTFRGMFRHALDDLRARDFMVPSELRDPQVLSAWTSPLAQALAAGWARYTGNDDSHWSASWNTGCR